MLSFRNKLFISYILLFVCLIVVVFPYIKQSADRLIKTTLAEYADELIVEAKDLQTTQQLIQWLKDHQHLVFFRISLISSSGKVLYDSHSRVPVDQSIEMQERYFSRHPEIGQALKYGTGYGEGYSYLLRMKMVYVAKPFTFGDQTFIVRTAFPRSDLTEVILEFDKWFFILGIIVLLLLSAVTWFVTYHFSYPIDTIVKAIRPYQEGRMEKLPKIPLKGIEGDFSKLAKTINSLSSHVQEQIQRLIWERNEKEVILESLVEGVVSVDGHMKVQYANRMALEFMGKEPQDILEKDIKALGWSTCEQLLLDSHHRNQLLTGHDQFGEKKKRYYQLTAVPKMRGTGAILVIQDVTEQHQMQEMRKDFVANASHELKTPITIVQGFAETLHEHPTLSKEHVVEITEKIVRNCRRMEALIRDLLALANAENLPQSRLIELDLVQLLTSCIQMLKGVDAEAQISLHYDQKKQYLLLADRSLLELAFMNLLENASKYSTKPARIEISLEQGDEMAIHFKDTGFGIPEEDLEHIFERFYRVDKARSRALGGSGLGLAIVRTVVEKHHGSIDAQSELGKGTTFTIHLPLRLEEGP